MKLTKKHLDVFAFCVEGCIADLTPEEVRLARQLLAEIRANVSGGKTRPVAYIVQDEEMRMKHGRDYFELKFPQDLRQKYEIEISLYKKDTL